MQIKSQHRQGIHFSKMSRPAEPNQPPNQQVPVALCQGVQQPEHEADHSPPPTVKVKNEWSYAHVPHMHSWHVKG